MSGNDKHVRVDSAFTPDYRNTLQQIAAEGECPAPFCKETADYHVHPVVRLGEYWKATINSFNYQQAQRAYLIIHIGHIENFDQVSPEAWAELQEVINVLRAKDGMEGATLVWRFGDKSFTGASVSHLHAHLISGYPRTEDAKPIMAVIGFARKE